MTRITVTIIDPPSGWMYGFPKIIPDEARKTEVSLREWLLAQGYPSKDIPLALRHSRYWHEEVRIN